jgi:hypothetical protein
MGTADQRASPLRWTSTHVSPRKGERVVKGQGRDAELPGGESGELFALGFGPCAFGGETTTGHDGAALALVTPAGGEFERFVEVGVEGELQCGEKGPLGGEVDAGLGVEEGCRFWFRACADSLLDGGALFECRSVPVSVQLAVLARQDAKERLEKDAFSTLFGAFVEGQEMPGVLAPSNPFPVASRHRKLLPSRTFLAALPSPPSTPWTVAHLGA